ncbi:MAG: GDSL-type esterase/lipase family protein [Negativicutes bacterium]|jgi:hypothetical protein
MEKEIPVHNKGINYFGRWDFSRPGVARIGWGSAYIKVRFTGNSLSIKLIDAPDNWWQFSVDGAPFEKFQAKAPVIELEAGLSDGEHDLFLFRRTEGGLGISQFGGLILANGGQVLEHDFSKNRCIEFVGNSIVCGFRNAGQDWDDEDSYMAFSVQLARLLNADWSCVSISGIGVVHNYDEPWPPSMPHLQDYYAQTYKCETEPRWNFTCGQPDVVLVATGTNDFTDVNRKPAAAEFKKGYSELIEVIRLNNPLAKIICTEPIPGWAGPLCRDWISELVKYYNVNGDNDVHYLAVNVPEPLLLDEHYVGDGTHPNILGGAIIAGYLKEKIANIVGWN